MVGIFRMEEKRKQYDLQLEEQEGIYVVENITYALAYTYDRNVVEGDL